MGVMTCFNFTGGALAFLMVQYLSGGKWGHVLRRPLEAMTRTIWLVVADDASGALPDEAPLSVGGVHDASSKPGMRFRRASSLRSRSSAST